MRLLLINYMETTAPGGINKVVYEVAKWMTKWGHDVVVFNPAWDKDKELTTEKISNFELRRGYKYSPLIYGGYLRNIKILRNLIAEFHPNVIHVHGAHTVFSGETVLLLKKHFKDVPIIFTPHYDPLNRNTLGGMLFGKFYDSTVNKYAIGMVDLVISISHFEAVKVMSIFKVPGHKIVVIPHGVPIVPKPTKKKFGDQLKLLYVGYLNHYKGVHYVIRALHYLVHEFGYTDVTLTIIGDGPEKPYLINLAKKLNVDRFVLWLPFMPHGEVINRMKTSDIFLLLSKSEGYGIVVAEALALGVPAIVTKGTALEEFTWEPGCFGVEYPPNPKKVAELIAKLATTSIRVGPFSKKIRPWEEVVRDYERVYTQLSKV